MDPRGLGVAHRACGAGEELSASQHSPASSGISSSSFIPMGQTKMGRYDFASWTLHMASIIIFANLWGLALREWRGTSRRTRGLVLCGLVLLVGSTIVVGYGSYLNVK